MGGKICPKCGHERRPGDYAPESECPRCGIVYAKVENPRSSEESPATPSLTEQLVRRKEIEMEESRAGDLVLSCVTAAFIGICLYIGICFCFSSWRFGRFLGPLITFPDGIDSYGEFVWSFVSLRNFFLAALFGLLFSPAIYKYIRKKRSSWRN